MTFGEHLEELRRRILWSLLAFTVLFVAALVFQDELMHFFWRPYHRAAVAINASLREDWAKKPHERSTEVRVVDLLLDKAIERHEFTPDEEKRARELQAKEHEEPPPQLDDKFNAISTGETLGAYMTICGLTALLVSAPILLWQLWLFIAAGLYVHERRVVLRVLPWSLLLFFVGFLFGYFVLAEMSVRFLVSYGDLQYVRPQVAVGAYLGMLFLLLLVMGLVFQVPLIMTVLSAIGLVKPDFYRSKRRHCILAIFVIAAIVTPPDYVSQLLVAGPMLLLFELGIFFASGAHRRRLARQAERAT